MCSLWCVCHFYSNGYLRVRHAANATPIKLSNLLCYERKEANGGVSGQRETERQKERGRERERERERERDLPVYHCIGGNCCIRPFFLPECVVPFCAGAQIVIVQ